MGDLPIPSVQPHVRFQVVAFRRGGTCPAHEGQVTNAGARTLLGKVQEDDIGSAGTRSGLGSSS